MDCDAADQVATSIRLLAVRRVAGIVL